MLLNLFIRYGYVTVFAAAAVEGDATLLAATFLSRRGYLHLPTVMLVAGLGSFAANQAYYWLARAYGRRPSAAPSSRTRDAVAGWLTRYGVGLVLVSRFAYGFRIAIPIACGATGMSPSRFIVADAAGAAGWAVAFGLMGFAIGHVLTLLIEDLYRYEGVVALALFLVASAVLIVRGRRRRARRATETREAP